MGDERESIDEQYKRAYDAQPMDTVDAWGDLASWRSAVGDLPQTQGPPADEHGCT